MTKRNNKLQVTFTKEELNSLRKKAKKSGLSMNGFIRCAIEQTEVKAAPPVDLPQLIIQIRLVNSQLSELLKLANKKGDIDTSELKAALKSNRKMEKEIVNIYTIQDDKWQ